MTTLQAFINQHRLRMTAEWADSNPHMTDPWDGATHWKCVLRKGRRRMTIYFSQGSAFSSEPDLKSVLDCIASDAAGIDNARSFENWADDYGYDIDSRKAEKTFKTCEKQAESLKTLLNNPDAYETLLYNTERL